jgi:5-bromo-4-chloroindolyl phosphate hydrolysis protein
MKNSEIVSAVVGGTFFAVPYLALGVSVFPSLAIGAAAFAAGELVFRTNVVKSLKETNLSLYETLEKAKKDNKHILDSIPKLENEDLKKTLNEINTSVDKIIKTIEKDPNKEKNVKNFFDYYLPVTVKLVDRYDEIENQKINSKDSKKFYENTINTINEINDVFKKFLNNLYQSDMIDTDVEIKVLNSMLKADGLDKNELNVKED